MTAQSLPLLYDPISDYTICLMRQIVKLELSLTAH